MFEPILQPSAITELLENVGGDRAFLAELVDTYLEDSPRLIETLREAIANGDAAAARRAAHTLKSTSASFGALGLAAECREIETAAAAGDLDGLVARVEAAQVTYQRVAAALPAAVRATEVS